jgi:hypothetical protein
MAKFSLGGALISLRPKIAFAAVALQGVAVICLIAAAVLIKPWLDKIGKYGDFQEDNCVQQLVLKSDPEGVKLQAQVVVGGNGWYQARVPITRFRVPGSTVVGHVGRAVTALNVARQALR